jgi:hypothetical protein
MLTEPGERAGIAAARSSGMAIPSKSGGSPHRACGSTPGRQVTRQPVGRSSIGGAGDDPLEGVRRHAEAGRHADAFHARKLPQMRGLAAHDRNLRLVDPSESQDVATRHDSHDAAPTGSATG